MFMAFELHRTVGSDTSLFLQVSIDLVRGDLLSPFLSQRSKFVDVLVFNPPYVPTDASEIGGCGIAASWAGGKDGMEVTNRLLPVLKVRFIELEVLLFPRF